MRVGYMTPFPSKYLMCRATNGILTSYVLTQMGALSMLNLTTTMQAGDVTLIMQHLNHLPRQKLEQTKKAPKQLDFPFLPCPPTSNDCSPKTTQLNDTNRLLNWTFKESEAKGTLDTAVSFLTFFHGDTNYSRDGIASQSYSHGRRIRGPFKLKPLLQHADNLMLCG